MSHANICKVHTVKCKKLSGVVEFFPSEMQGNSFVVHVIINKDNRWTKMLERVPLWEVLSNIVAEEGLKSHGIDGPVSAYLSALKKDIQGCRLVQNNYFGS